MPTRHTIPAGSGKSTTGSVTSELEMEHETTPATGHEQGSWSTMPRPGPGPRLRPGSHPDKPVEAAIWKGYLEMRLGNGPVARRLLTEPHVVIGRIPTVQLLLDHHTVSRRHAEMYCDPFGRWWIRDLGSTNGTLVNEEAVSERVLQPGDRIGIGDFLLTFYLDPQSGSRAAGDQRYELDDDLPTAIRKLGEFEPPRIAAEHLFTLMRLSRRLIAIEDPAERMKALCQLTIGQDFGGSMALVLRLRSGAVTILSGPHRPRTAVDDERPYISRRVLSAVQETREPVLAGNLQTTSTTVDLTMSRDVMALWVVACPLRRDEEIDLLYVTFPPDFGGVEWLSLIALAAEVFQQAESAWIARRHAQENAAIERELEMARQIQRALVPRRQEFELLDVAVGFEPCKWVGGDYADVVPMPDGRMLLSVADVCGKGLQAALISSSLQTMVRATVESGRGLVELVNRLNRHLCEYLPSHSFVTFVCLAIDMTTGQAECLNAGHPPPLIVAVDGKVRQLQSETNPALGLAQTSWETKTDKLERGEVLAMFTDGLTELRNTSKEMLGLSRLGENLSAICLGGKDDGMSQLSNKLTLMLEEFRGDQLPEDDRAFLLAKRKTG
jgi:phosphoserine phosphatase RsbU/P